MNLKLTIISIISFFILFFAASVLCAIPAADNAVDDDGERDGAWVILLDDEMYEAFDEEDALFYGMLNYENGDIDGTLKVYYSTGQLYFESDVYGTDPVEVYDGIVTFYDKDGNISKNIMFNEDEQDGPAEFYAGGKLWKKGQYTNGIATGIWEEHYEDTTYSIGELNNTTKLGKWKYYYSDGNICSEGAWLNNMRDGEWKFYATDGNLSFQGNYVNDSQDGDWTQYFSDNSYGIGKMSDFKKFGEWVIYPSDGSGISKGSFIDDRRHGDWQLYDKAGNVIRTVKFYYGVEVTE